MPLEIIPKPVKYREWRRRALLGVYFPVAEPRPVYEGDVVDGAVNERRKRDSGYDPVNLRDAPLPRRKRPSHNIAGPQPGDESCSSIWSSAVQPISIPGNGDRKSTRLNSSH